MYTILPLWASLVAKMVKHLLAMKETQVQSLGREDPMEKEMATDSSILAWRIPWTAEPGRLQSMGSQRVRHEQLSHTHILSLFLISKWSFKRSTHKHKKHTDYVS